MPGNQHYIEKADLSIADLSSGGLLLPQQTKEFFDIAIDKSTLLSMVTTQTMSAPSLEVSKFGFTQRVLRPAYEGTALPEADRSKPELGKVTLTTKEFIAEARIPYGVVEDNIINGSFPQYAISRLGEAVSRDMEEILIQGDTTSPDNFLSRMDGVLKMATTQVVNAGGNRLDKSLLKQMIQTMPSKYMRDQRSLMLLTSKNAAIDYADSLANRQTQLGDDNIKNWSVGEYAGFNVIPIPMFPENLGGGTNTTNVLLVDPKNIVVGMQRDVRIETDRDISAREFIIVATVRFGVVYKHEPALVKATNVLATAGA